MVPAQARTLSFASANPPADTGFNRALQWWADQIKERTDGALDVKIYYMGSLLIEFPNLVLWLPNKV